MAGERFTSPESHAMPGVVHDPSWSTQLDGNGRYCFGLAAACVDSEGWVMWCPAVG